MGGWVTIGTIYRIPSNMYTRGMFSEKLNETNELLVLYNHVFLVGVRKECKFTCTNKPDQCVNVPSFTLPVSLLVSEGEGFRREVHFFWNTGGGRENAHVDRGEGLRNHDRRDTTPLSRL